MPNLMRFGTGGGSGSADFPVIGEDFNWTGGDGTYQVTVDSDGDWKIRLLYSGVFTPLKNMTVDAFLVGAGGGKGAIYTGGGGSGYTTTVKSATLTANTAYQITVGAAGANSDGMGSTPTDGGTTSAFSKTAAGGKASANGSNSSKKPGGAGGSGGGGYNASGGNGTKSAASGGTNGSSGTTSTTAGGTGQGTTTREFGETSGDLYASGGGDNLTHTIPNSGNGGANGIAPADGIVVIRLHKTA